MNYSSTTQRHVAKIYQLGVEAHHVNRRGYPARLAREHDIAPGTISKATIVAGAAARIGGDADDVLFLRMFWEQATGSERGILAAAEELLYGNPWPWMAVFGASENAYHTMRGNPVKKVS